MNWLQFEYARDGLLSGRYVFIHPAMIESVMTTDRPDEVEITTMSGTKHTVHADASAVIILIADGTVVP